MKFLSAFIILYVAVMFFYISKRFFDRSKPEDGSVAEKNLNKKSIVTEIKETLHDLGGMND